MTSNPLRNVLRSESYANAVAEYVAKHRNEDITAKLNAVYADLPGEIDPALRRAQARSVAEEWSLRDER